MTIQTLDLQFLGQEQTIGVFLIETSAGPVLVETGPYSTFPTLQKALALQGYTTTDIKHVFLTHIHFDHAGAAWAFAKAGATIYVHPAGAPHLIDPTKLIGSASRIYGDDMERLWSTIEPIDASRIQEVADGESYQVGDLHMKAWYTPGHASHHIAWQADHCIFAGDVAGVRIGGGPVVPPCPPPDIDIALWKKSIATLRSIDHLETLFLTHFGGIKDISEHLDQLEAVLDDWSQWMLKHFNAGTPISEVTPLFQNYAATQLREAGVDEEGVMQYEHANPAWMSVAGLLRYWKKKLGTKN